MYQKALFRTDFLNQRLLTVCALGFFSGLPLGFTASFLQGWFADSGVAIATIGFLGLIGLPYVLKFLWSPLLDRYVMPFCGRRRGWIITTQLVLATTMALMVFFAPQQTPLILGFLGLIVAFFSATQDIAVDAYRAELLHPDERGMGAAYTTAGYRLALLISAGGSLILADYFGWQLSCLTMAALMATGILVSYFGPEPACSATPPRSLVRAVIDPLKEFTGRDNAVALLLLILLYKLGDAFAGSLSLTFLLRGVGFSLTEVGSTIKVLGLTGTLSGVFLGGCIMARLNLFHSMLLFGILQACSNLLFLLLAIIGKNYLAMVFAVFVESMCAGMGTAALLALLMSLCDVRYTATQFALLSSLASVGRVIVSPIAGVMVEHMGWANFFGWTFIIAMPGLFILTWLRADLNFEKVAEE